MFTIESNNSFRKKDLVLISVMVIYIYTLCKKNSFLLVLVACVNCSIVIMWSFTIVLLEHEIYSHFS